MSKKPNCVVVDTNVWCSHLLLQSPTAKAFIYTLRRKDWCIGLPEVVEKELPFVMAELGDELAKDGGRINTLLDLPIPIDLSKQAMFKKVQERLKELEPLVRQKFTCEHAEAAFQMVIEKLPPNKKGHQQFKDSAIWQAALELTRTYTVHLITRDKGFFLNPEDPSKGLAQNLLKDCERAGATIKAYDEISPFMTAMLQDVPSFNRKDLIGRIERTLIPVLQVEASRQKFTIGELLDIKTHVFRTQKQGPLAVDCRIITRAKYVEGNRDWRAIAHGSCYYEPERRLLIAAFLLSVMFEWEGKDSMGKDSWSRRARSFNTQDPTLTFPRPPELQWDTHPEQADQRDTQGRPTRKNKAVKAG